VSCRRVLTLAVVPPIIAPGAIPLIAPVPVIALFNGLLSPMLSVT
jgi:hypothetical protein